jgi:hypothetical protein
VATVVMAVVSGALGPLGTGVGAAMGAPVRAASASVTDGVSVGGEAAASQRAAASGESVEVEGERTEYSTTDANPDGTFTLTQETSPQRVHAADGSWRGVDPTLERYADGSVGPRAAVVDVNFSGGGSGANMLRLGSGQGSMSLGWPGTLPVPTLSGATATYAEVLKGVDLELTATAEGYREILVVKSAEAASSPDLDQAARLSAAREKWCQPSRNCPPGRR